MSGPNPLLQPDPLRLRDGRPGLVYETGSGPAVLRGSACGPYLEGWRAVLLYTGFAPILLLRLRHPLHGDAVWYVSPRGERLGDSVAALAERERALLRARATPVLAGLIGALFVSARPVLDHAQQGYLALDPGCREDLLALCREAVLAPVGAFALDEIGEQMTVRPAGAVSPVQLDRAAVARALEQDLQEGMPRTVARQALELPCPVTGAATTCQGSVCIDDFHFLYRFVGSGGLVFYAVAGQERSFVYALYVPEAASVFYQRRWEGAALPLRSLLPNWLADHAIRYGALLERYLSQPLTGITSPLRAPPWSHIGHQLWNELSGIEALLPRLDPDATLPEFVVPDGLGGVEFYGPIDRLFPALEGQVRRGLRDARDLVQDAYRRGRLVLRITAEHVPERLRRRVLAHAEATVAEPPGLGVSGTAGDPVLLLGLRVENRTLVDLAGFYDRLVERVLAGHGSTRFLIDGHNLAPGRDGKFGSFGERRDDSARVQAAEHAVLERLQRRFGDAIVGAVGLSLQQNLLLARRCDGFVSMWGAGLAKYRWVCNLPGYVITSRWNLSHRSDLHIYDLPSMMEDPAPLRWVEPDRVTDLPEAPRLLGHLAHPQWSNFTLDEEAVLGAIMEWIATLGTASPA